MFGYGQKSNLQLDTVEDALANVMRLAIQKSPVDFSILEGARTLNRQYELFAKGRSVAELRAAGVPSNVIAQPTEIKVTWTLKSNHFVPAGHTKGRAVDVGVYPYDPSVGRAVYAKIAVAVFAAAKELGVKIRWGGDWDGDGVVDKGETDLGHYELA